VPDRLSHYDEDYYLNLKWFENRFYAHKMLRPGDMDAALGYAYGLTSYEQVRQILGPEDALLPACEQEARLWENLAARRVPRLVLDVGAGRGELSFALGRIISCIAIDPSPGAAILFHKTRQEWGGDPDVRFINATLHDALWRLLWQHRVPDTAIFCETLEHIPEDEFTRSWPLLKGALSSHNGDGLLIVTNRLDFHPILVDGSGWDRIRLVDDDLYDWLAAQGRETVFRQGSHLVVRF